MTCSAATYRDRISSRARVSSILVGIKFAWLVLVPLCAHTWLERVWGRLLKAHQSEPSVILGGSDAPQQVLEAFERHRLQHIALLSPSCHIAIFVLFLAKYPFVHATARSSPPGCHVYIHCAPRTKLQVYMATSTTYWCKPTPSAFPPTSIPPWASFLALLTHTRSDERAPTSDMNLASLGKPPRSFASRSLRP
jgi:hypothetical protein